MADTKYLYRPRGTVYYFQIAVPLDLQEATERKLWRKSLDTTSLREAQRRRWDAYAEYKAWLDRKIAGQPISGDDIARQKAAEVRRVFDDAGIDDLGFRAGLVISADPDDRIVPTRQHEKRAREIIEAMGAEVTDEGVADLALALAEAVVDAWQYQKRGMVPPVPERATAKAARGKLGIVDGGEQYLATKAVLTANTLAEYRVAYRRFGERADCALADVTRDDAVSFLDGLDLAAATKNKHGAGLRGLFAWAIQRGHHDGPNPFEGLSQAVSHRGKSWLPFTPAELKKLLEAPEIAPERHTWHTARKWALWCLLYSGLRPGELCALERSEIRTERGITFFDITASKSEAGERQVPVHSKLIDLGWLDYLGFIKAGPIFPGLRPRGHDQKRSNHLSHDFPRWRRGRGVTRERVVLYSLRKNFITALREAGVHQADVAALVGHEPGFTFSTYAPTGLSLKAKRDLVERVQYPDLS